MKTSMYCLIFILTNTVMAQASEFGTNHLSTQKWITNFAGETEVDGLPVIAKLDVSDLGLQIPEAMANNQDTMVPSVLPVIRHSYRLTLLVSEKPRLQFTYIVQPRTISIDGSPRFAYVNELAVNKDIQFIITSERDGSMHVSYARKGLDGASSKGDFVLVPVPHILAN